jgi:hypothetical protein
MFGSDLSGSIKNQRLFRSKEAARMMHRFFFALNLYSISIFITSSASAGSATCCGIP